MAYFHRTGPTTFRATENVGGAWTLLEQHIAPALGLLVHVIESDRDARRGDDLVVARLSYDILGTLPKVRVGSKNVKLTMDQVQKETESLAGPGPMGGGRPPMMPGGRPPMMPPGHPGAPALPPGHP